MAGWRPARRIALTLLAILVVVPLFVIGASLAGLEPTHWSGARLSGVELLPTHHRTVAAPEPANVLLSGARDQDETDAGDLAPSYWDPDAVLVVLGAVTDAGAQRREALGRSSGTAYRVQRRRHSSRELTETMDGVIPDPSGAAVMSSTDARGDRVELTVTRLDHSVLARIGGHGGAVAARLSPLQPLAYLDGPPPNPPSQWSRADPVGTWFTLLTGFPWYLGTVLAVVAVGWVVVRARRPGRDVRSPASV
jgi:hypothetical protein